MAALGVKQTGALPANGCGDAFGYALLPVESLLDCFHNAGWIISHSGIVTPKAE
jgi:hypothetical protein